MMDGVCFFDHPFENNSFIIHALPSRPPKEKRRIRQFQNAEIIVKRGDDERPFKAIVIQAALAFLKEDIMTNRDLMGHFAHDILWLANYWEETLGHLYPLYKIPPEVVG